MKFLLSACTLLLCYDLFQIDKHQQRSQCQNGSELARVQDMVDIFMDNVSNIENMVFPVQQANLTFLSTPEAPFKFSLVDIKHSKFTHLSCITVRKHRCMYIPLSLTLMFLSFTIILGFIAWMGINIHLNQRVTHAV